MKKVLKITALFIMLISLFTLTASAEVKTIQWDDDYDTETYSYGGELKLGGNIISPIRKPNIFNSEIVYLDNVYYEFNAEKSGYYTIVSVGDLFLTPQVSQNIGDGIIYGEEEWIFLSDGILVYLEEGTCIFGISFLIYEYFYPDDVYSGEINIEYIAEEITDMQIEEGYLEDILLEEHISPEYDDDNISGIPAKGKLIFNSGKEVEFDQYLDFEYPENIAPGKNEIIFNIPNFKKTFTVDIKTVDDYIKNIEIGNADEVAVVSQTFVPYIAIPPEPDNIELVFTLPDGTKKTEDVSYYYDFELKGDKFISVWCEYYQKEDGEWYLVVELANEEYLNIPCKKVPASALANYILYFEGITEFTCVMFDDFSWYIAYAFDFSSGMSIDERMQCFSEAFNAVSTCCSDIRELTGYFIDYIR